MKYEQKIFQIGGYRKSLDKNWEETFGKKKDKFCFCGTPWAFHPPGPPCPPPAPPGRKVA